MECLVCGSKWHYADQCPKGKGKSGKPKPEDDSPTREELVVQGSGLGISTDSTDQEE